MNTMVNFSASSPYDAEATEMKRMKEESAQMIHDMLTQIDALLDKIDTILAREHE